MGRLPAAAARPVLAACCALLPALGANAASTTPPGDTTPEAAVMALEPAPLPERTTIRVGMSAPLESFLSILLADALGELDRENLDIEIEYLPVGDSTRLLSRGDLDVVPTSYSAGNLNLIAETEAMRFVAPLDVPNPDRPEGLWAHRDALGGDGFQPDDLSGARVLTFSGLGTPWEPYVFGEFEQAGSDLAPTDVTFERVGVAETAPALAGGAADFALVLSPFYEFLVDDECCEYVGLWPPYPQGAIAFGPRLLDDERAVGEAFLRAVARTVVTYLQGDYQADDTVRAAISELLDVPEDVLAERIPTLWDTEFSLPPEDAFVSTQDFYAANDLLAYDDPLAYDEVFDLAFLAALRP